METAGGALSRKRTHYQVLGINTDVSSAEVKRAYRALVKTQHPDAQIDGNGNGAHEAATEEMMCLNEAYETLKDHRRRAEYDLKIGIRKDIRSGSAPVFSAVDEDRQREKFLAKVFNPTRLNLAKLLNAYKKEIRELSLDPYDDELLGQFQEYAGKIEAVLRKGSDGVAAEEVPKSLEAAVHMLKNAMAQAADGLDELNSFCLNYDYQRLSMAENLFRIANDLLKQAFALTKGR
jgi:molecular chaperone DnaJ